MELTIKEKKPAVAGGLVAVEQQRAIQEVQAAMIIAKKFPRDVDESYTRIMRACERKTLAENAMYGYPRGGQMVTGPSIRLAEVLAQNWGNLQFGIRELSQGGGESEVEAFAWDIETNTRQIKVFKVPHQRYTKKGIKNLSDPRDIYEMVANQGARRLRACILGVIPGDIIDASVKQCEKTLQDAGGTPIEDRTRKMLIAFDKFGVTKKMIQERIGHKTDAIIESELVDLIKIYTSLRDGMSQREDWFAVSTVETSAAADDLNQTLSGPEKKDPEKKPDPPAQEEPEEKPAGGQGQYSGPWSRPRWHRLKSPGMIKFAQDYADSFNDAPEAIQEAFRAKWLLCEETPEQFPFDAPDPDAGNDEESISEVDSLDLEEKMSMSELWDAGNPVVKAYCNRMLGIPENEKPDLAKAVGWMRYYRIAAQKVSNGETLPEF